MYIFGQYYTLPDMAFAAVLFPVVAVWCLSWLWVFGQIIDWAARWLWSLV